MRRMLAAAFATMLLCLPGAALADELTHDDGTLEAALALGPDASYAVSFDAPGAGGYQVDAVSLYLSAAAPGPYPVTVLFWDAALAALPAQTLEVDYQAEGWYLVPLAAPVPFAGAVRVGVSHVAGALALGSDTTLPVDGFSSRFDAAGWTAVADADLGIRATVTSTTPGLACVGFQAPANRTVKMKKGGRTLPLKAELFDAAGAPVTDGLAAAPVVTVLYAAAAGDTPVDVSAFVLPAGRSNTGAAFRLTDEGFWKYNLKTKGFAAAGYYTVSLGSGDEAAYLVEPGCTAQFVIGDPKPKKGPKK